MPNRSKTKKLRLIFIFDLIIISLAAAGYLYIQPSIAGEATLAAEFQVSDLSVSPSEVRANLPVIISVNVTNTGNDSGDVVIELLLNDVLEQSQLAQLFAGESKIVEFSVTKTTLGTYTVKIADLVGSFKVIEAAPVIEDPGTGELPSGPADGRPANIVASNLVVSPSEVWAGQSVTISGLFTNHGDKTGYSTVSLRINGESVGSENVALLGGTNTRVQFTITAGGVGEYQVKLGALTGSLKVVQNGKHTLIIGAKGAKAEFTLDGKPYVATVSVLVDVGSHTIAMPPTDPTGEYRFLNWEDDRYNTNPTRTVNVQSAIRYEAVYEGGASCPSLYYWNGSEYVYVAEISNGGWLGYIGHIDANGEITFLGSNPWDHAKISDNDLELTTIDGKDYYDMKLSQRWSEIFYMDRAYMIVADHSSDVDVHATMVHYLDPTFTDEIYTVSKELATPVSAVNEKGDDVLADIAELDGDFTPGFNGVQSPAWDDLYWNVLTLDLGDLSDAERIKLVINGMVDWGWADDYYAWIDLFKQAAEDGLIADGTPVTPPPYLEIKDANGDWVRVTDKVQLPIPADYVARSFVVDITELFPEDTVDYMLRVNNFWNVTFDYIGIDTTPQADLEITKIEPTAEMYQVLVSPSAAAGNFTKYGDVTELLLDDDLMYIVGRQGDEVALLFPVEGLNELGEGMERDVFLFVSCWFKDPVGNWGYEFDFTVEPMPFYEMSGFPYPETESYPYDAEHLAYLNEYNTRMIVAPQVQGASILPWVGAVALVVAVVDFAVLMYFRKRGNTEN